MRPDPACCHHPSKSSRNLKRPNTRESRASEALEALLHSIPPQRTRASRTLLTAASFEISYITGIISYSQFMLPRLRARFPFTHQGKLKYTELVVSSSET